MMNVKEISVPYEEFGPKSDYWLASFENPSPLEPFLPIRRLRDLAIPKRRAQWLRDSSDGRRALVQAFRESNLPLSQSQNESLDKLSHPEALAVVTGQQPGLLGGPLYTFAKILTAITLTQRLNSEWGVPVVPILWDGADDHDLEEIDRFDWPGKDPHPLSYQLGISDRGNIPAWSITLEEPMLERLIHFIEQSYPETEYRKDCEEFIHQIWSRCKVWPDFFDQFWLRIFETTPLLVVRPWEEGFRRLARPVVKEELENPTDYQDDLSKESEQLGSIGFSPHIHKRENLCSFFLLEAERRERVFFEDGQFVTGETGKRYSVSEIQKLLDESPRLFSPNAVLRPIVQDHILPTAVAVLGPAELAYHAQLTRLYQRHSVPRPWIVPRFSLTLLGDSQSRHLEELDLRLPDLVRDVNDLAKQSVRSDTLDHVETLIAGFREATGDCKRNLVNAAENQNADLKSPLDKQFGRIEKTIEQIGDLFRRDEMKRQKVTLDRIRALQGHLTPNGELQERVYGLVPHLCRFGFGWIRTILDRAEEWDGGSHLGIILGGSDVD